MDDAFEYRYRGFGILGQAAAQGFAAAGDQLACIDFAAAAHEPIAGARAITGALIPVMRGG